MSCYKNVRYNYLHSMMVHQIIWYNTPIVYLGGKILSAILKKGISTFDLKIIGIILMFIDHIHQMFVPFGAPDWLDYFGRPVATLFFFVSVVGFSHTRNKKKYMLRLYLSMVLMSFFTFFLQKIVGYEQVVLINNIFRDLFIGTLMMAGVDLIVAGKQTKSGKKISGGILLFLLPILFSLLLPVFLTNSAFLQNQLVVMPFMALTPALLLAENNVMVLLIPLLYLAKDNRKIQCLLIAAVSVVYFILGSTQWMMIFAIVPILLYNGQKGRGIKYFFYVFYPAHIAILYLISAFLYNR